MIRLPLEAMISTLDPAAAQDAVSRRLTGQLFDTLVDWDPAAATPTLVPELLATPPTLDAGGTTLRLQLRVGDDARRFTADPCLAGDDSAKLGRPVKASDVAASLLRHADPGIAGAWELLAGRIVGLDAWRDAAPGERAPLPEGIAIDDTAGTITLRLTRPQPELPAILASPQLAIVPPECVAYYDGRDDAHPPFARHPVGSGPYRLDRGASELPRAAVLIARDDGPRPPMPGPAAARCPTIPGVPRIILEHPASPEAALRLFQAGEIATLAPGQAHFAEVIEAGAPIPGAVPADTQLTKSPVLSTTLLVFRMDDPELGQSADPAVDAEHRARRQAIAAAFDDRRYHQVIRNGAWGEPASQVVPRVLLDPGAAAPLHPSAGPGRPPPPPAAADAPRRELRYATTTGPAAQQEAAILREALRPLGYDLVVTHDDAYLYKILSGQARAQLFSLRFDADYPDPASFLDPFVCQSPGSYTGYCSPRFDAVHARFARTPAGPERDALAIELERILGDDVPVRPIDTPELWTLSRGWLGEVVRHPITGLRAELLCPLPARDASR
ncbi:MAG: hypothetical protein H6711_07405 [Myxococcales bacterium]|nr:hypothetical protein [Myxococcales bacterium]